MGYRSEVAYAIAFRNEQDKNTFLATVPDDLLARLRKSAEEDGEGLVETEDMLRLHINGWKWYATRLMFGVMEGYSEVDDHEALIQLSKDFADGENGVPMTGVFARLGDEDDDDEYDYWGEDPEGVVWSHWELISIRRFIETGWDQA